VRKFDQQEDVSNKRRVNRRSFKSNDDEKPDFDVFGFDG